ncbi:MAG: hypothetical protein Q8N23_26640 [Archangium sp.]|nr:hypothetical protein [Archangium sp.]MDP3156282.1 hypothetical protein [Archangium sp.]MDP3570326.1 hypothetical protein [Archangium sp.]
MKIESSNQTQQCEAEAPLTTPVAPKVCVDRVEQARVEERVFAGERSFTEEKLFEAFAAVPSPGALELEVKGKVMHQGGKAKITADRDESGEFLIRVEGQAQGAFSPHPVVALELSASGAVTYRVRTPEAAADLLHALLTTADKPKLAHYSEQSLERVEVGLEFGPSAHGMSTIKYGGLDLAAKGTAWVDFNKNLLVTEQAVAGEAFGRTSVIAARVGIEGELALRLRTETALPRDMLSRIASGELSAGDVIRESECTRRLVVEGEHREEVTTVFAPGYSLIQKLEGEVDLDQLISDPLEPGLAIKGSLTTLMSNQNAVGVGFDIPGLNMLVRGAIYSKSEQHLFQGHDDHALQKELDLNRSLR